mgnify:CR=1 FL=1
MRPPLFRKRKLHSLPSGNWLEKSIIGILAALGLTLGLALIIGECRIHRQPAARAAQPVPAMAPPNPMEPAALKALESFFEAPDLTKKAAFVRDTARVLPMMNDYHERRGHPFPTLGRVSPGHVAHFDETPMVLFEVEPFSGPRYPVAVVWDGQRFAVDWESLTAYGTMDWNEFVESQPTAIQTLRVYLQRSTEAEQIPNATAGSKAFRIEHRDGLPSLVAIADAEVAAILAPRVENQRAPVTLEIAWRPLDSSGLSVPKILRLVAPRWSP